MTTKQTRLIMVRHGQTLWNHERRIQGGSSDTPLSENGQQQIKDLGLSMKEVKIRAVYSSPLQRAQNTAQAIANHHHLKVNIEPDFRELEVGQFEGMSIEGLTKDFSSFLLDWREGDGKSKLPGGESLADLRDRTWGKVQEIISGTNGTVVVVSRWREYANSGFSPPVKVSSILPTASPG
jgi:broad specificity phosphatase PhoE